MKTHTKEDFENLSGKWTPSHETRSTRALSRDGARAFGPPWQRERAKLIREKCEQIHARRAGESVTAAARRLARSLRGRCYQCEPARRVRISARRLENLFYAWQRSGEPAFALRYTSSNARFTLTRSHLASVRRLVLSSDTLSFAAVFRGLFPHGTAPRSGSRFINRFTPAFVRHSRAIFRARTRARAVERRFARYIATKETL